MQIETVHLAVHCLKGLKHRKKKKLRLAIQHGVRKGLSY